VQLVEMQAENDHHRVAAEKLWLVRMDLPVDQSNKECDVDRQRRQDDGPRHHRRTAEPPLDARWRRGASTLAADTHREGGRKQHGDRQLALVQPRQGADHRRKAQHAPHARPALAEPDGQVLQQPHADEADQQVGEDLPGGHGVRQAERQHRRGRQRPTPLAGDAGKNRREAGHQQRDDDAQRELRAPHAAHPIRQREQRRQRGAVQ
jgi:hypothetical protein